MARQGPCLTQARSLTLAAAWLLPAAAPALAARGVWDVTGKRRCRGGKPYSRSFSSAATCLGAG